MKEVKSTEFQLKFLELIIRHQMAISTNFIDFLELQIKLRQEELVLLRSEKTFWFQKKRLKYLENKIKKLEIEIKYFYGKLNSELKDIYSLDDLRENYLND